MNANGPSYAGLLKTLASRHGCSLEYSRPELVSGGLTPPPSRVYPGTVCYMVTVHVGRSSYPGFGPTPVIATNAAELEAYNSLSALGHLPPAITKPGSPMPALEAESWVASELDDDLILGERGLNREECTALGETSTPRLCVSTSAMFKKVNEPPTKSSHAGRRDPPTRCISSTTEGVTQNRVQSSSNRVPVRRNERFCEIPQKPYTVPKDMDGLMQALADAPTDTEGEGAFRFTGTEKKDITDLARQAAQRRGLNLVFKSSVIGPPYSKQVLVTAVCGDMQFEGRHSKKKVARDMASKKLLDALAKREQQQRDQRRPGRSPPVCSPAPSDSCTSGFISASFPESDSCPVSASFPESDSCPVSASFPESDSCPVSVPSINDPPSHTAANDHSDDVPGSKQSSSHVTDLSQPSTSTTGTQPTNAPRTRARSERVLGPAFSMANIWQSSSSEYESDGAHSVMSLPITTLRQRATGGRGFSHNPVGQLQEIMMKELHYLPVYAEGVETVGKYAEYISVVSAKGLSAKGVGCSKKLARRHAAENMLGIMEKEGMTTNPSLIDNRFRKLMRPSNFRSKLAVHTNPHHHPAFEHQQTPTPSPPSPSSPCQLSPQTPRRQSNIQPPLHQPNPQASPLQPNPRAPPLQPNPQAPPRQPNPQTLPLQRNPQASPLQRNPQASPRQPNPQPPPRQLNLQAPPRQPNPQAPPRQPNPQAPPRQPNAQGIPHQTNHQTLPCQQQQTPLQQSNPKLPLHQQSPLRQQPPPCQLNRQSPPSPSNPQMPPWQSKLQAPPRQQTSRRQQNHQATPRQPNPQRQARQQAPPFSPRFPNTHVRPPPHQRSNHPFSSSHSNQGKSPKSPPKQHSRWQPRSPMQRAPMGPEPHSFPPFTKPCMPYGPPSPTRAPLRPSSSQVPGMQHPTFQGPTSWRGLLPSPPFPGPPPFTGSPPPRVPPNFQRLHPYESQGSHPGFQGPHQQSHGSPPRPRNGMRFSAQAPNHQGNARYPSKQLPSAASQSHDAHSTASSQQAYQATANTTLSPTMRAFSQTHLPITSADSESESDPEISLQVSCGLFEMFPPGSISNDSSNLNNSVVVCETTIPELVQDDKIADGDTNENPVRDSTPNSSPTVLPIATSVTSVGISQNLTEDTTTWSPKSAVSSESKEPLTIPEIGDSKQTEVAPSHPSHGDIPPSREALDCVAGERLPVDGSNGSNTATMRENGGSLITQDSYEAEQFLDPTVEHCADDVAPSGILTPTNVTPAALKISTSIPPEGQLVIPGQDVVKRSTCGSFAKCRTDLEMMPSGVIPECIEIGKLTSSTQTKGQCSSEQNKPVKSTWVPVTQQITPHFDQPHSNPLNFSVRLPRDRPRWSSTAGVSKEACQPKPTLPPWVGTSPKPCPNSHPQPHLEQPLLQKHLNPQDRLSDTSQTPQLPVHPLLLMTQDQSKITEGIMDQQQNGSSIQPSNPTCVNMLEKFGIAEMLVDSDVCTLLPTEGSHSNLVLRTHLGSILK